MSRPSDPDNDPPASVAPRHGAGATKPRASKAASTGKVGHQSMRQVNRSVVLDLIRATDTISRPERAARSGREIVSVARIKSRTTERLTWRIDWWPTLPVLAAFDALGFVAPAPCRGATDAGGSLSGSDGRDIELVRVVQRRKTHARPGTMCFAPSTGSVRSLTTLPKFV